LASIDLESRCYLRRARIRGRAAEAKRKQRDGKSVRRDATDQRSDETKLDDEVVRNKEVIVDVPFISRECQSSSIAYPSLFSAPTCRKSKTKVAIIARSAFDQLSSKKTERERKKKAHFHLILL